MSEPPAAAPADQPPTRPPAADLAAPPTAAAGPGPATPAAGAPRLPLWRLFARFLRFGLLAFGGPVAQIGMLRHELIDRERWTDKAHFLRALAVYQALPGPEAHELCCWFGYLARGRLGSLVAGLGFMLPGTLLMLGLAWLYANGHLDAPLVRAAFAGMQPAVVALVVFAVPRIARGALRSPIGWLGAASAAGADAAGLPFWSGLLVAALLATIDDGRARLVLAVAFAAICGAVAFGGAAALGGGAAAVAAPSTSGGGGGAPGASFPALLGLGLQAGLLTFGGAYTAIPVVRNETVLARGWLSDTQFLDAIALGGVLPAPLIVFGTFVGYVAGGLGGALAMTVGIFAPAFAFTLFGHAHLERLVRNPSLRRALEGIAAGVVGLIAATALRLCLGLGGGGGAATWVVFAAALLLVALWRSPWATPAAVLLGAALALGTFALHGP